MQNLVFMVRLKKLPQTVNRFIKIEILLNQILLYVFFYVNT